MEQQFDFDVLVKLKSKKRKKIWKRIVSAMMCLVVFCTTYMLILPAITKENQAFCGIEEHTHDEKCYEKTLLCEDHVHTEECYKTQTNLICTEPTDDGHTHGEACSPITETTLVCGQEETPGHTHGEACSAVTETSLTCALAESEGHTHTESCSSTETVLSCLEDHAHGDACYTTVTTIICGIEESSGHAHSDGCYTTTTTYGCGMEETQGHTHTDACYTAVTTYSCGLEESAPSHVHTDACYETIQQNCLVETAQDHEHTDDCYSKTLICTHKEHTHTTICFSDSSADLESASTWEATLPQLSGEYAADVLAIAKSQLGYRESTRNYIVTEDNEMKGYTRYGAWYGIPYGDWCAMFVSFCLHYAGVEEMPLDANCPNWVKALQEQDLYQTHWDYIPQPGDIIFFDWENDGRANHVGIVEEVIDTDVVTIEGNSGDRVTKNKYELHDDRIAGYGVLVENPDAPIAGKVRPEDVIAWASLIGPDGQIINKPVEETVTAKLTSTIASTFNLRRNATLNSSARATGTPLDLTPYIIDVTMYDAKGNPIPSDSVVTEGDLIEFRIDYTLTGQQLGVMNGQSITVYTNTLTYKIPSNFKVIRNDSGYIANAAGQTVGTFLIDSATGDITMTFSDTYVEDNAAGSQIQGNISFFSTVTKITDADDENQKYAFTDDITLGIIIKEEIEAVGNLRVEKEVVSVDGDLLTYQVKVTSTEGTFDDVTFTDKMAAGLTFDRGQEVRKNGTLVNNIRFNPAADGKSFTMTLPQMAAGDTYTLRYTCTADIDLLDADMTARNTATVTSKNNLGKELEHQTTVGYTFDMMEKTGVDNGDGTISWTITINQAKVDVSGWTLLDKINSVDYTGTVTIKDSSGNVVAQNTKLPYTFPEGSDDTYTVTYTTAYDYSGSQSVSNKAILKKDDTEITIVTGVNIGTPITKTGTYDDVIRDENGTNLLPITWTVTIDTSKGSIPAGSVLKDLMEDWTAGEMYMTYDQLMAAYQAISAELVRVGSGNPTRFVASVHVPGMGYNDALAHNYGELTGNVDGAQSKVYENFAITLNKAIPKDQVLTFSYQAYGTFKNNVVTGATFTNQMTLNDMYKAIGSVQLKSGSVDSIKYPFTAYDPDVFDSHDMHWNLDWVGHGSVMKVPYDQLKDGRLAWAIELMVPPDYWGKGDIVLYEDLPEGVSIKDLKLAFNSDAPTEKLRMQDIKPNNTYTWDFMLYPADQHGQWRPTGGQEVSIIVRVTEDGDLEITMPGVLMEVMSQHAARNNAKEWFCFFYIVTQIDEDFEWTPKDGETFVYVDPFKNQYTLKEEDGKVLGIGSQTTEVTKDERDGVIRKEATTDGNNIITYSVVLNSYSRDLIENSGILAIHDELTYTETAGQPLRLRLVPGSVTLFEVTMNADGTYTKGKDITPNYSYNEDSTVQYGITHWSHTIDMIVPDSKALLLEYKYKASGIKNVTHNVGNACTISGVGEGSLEGDTTVEIEVKDASAQANTAGVMLYKVDANSDGVFLQNAVFNIYIWNEEQGKYIIVHHPNNGGSDFVTNASGMILLDGTTIAEGQFAYNTAYYIVEKESPNGYYLSPEPYYFYIAHSDTTAYPPCGLDNGFNSHALSNGDIIYRENVSVTTEISIEKYWKSYNGGNITVTGDRVPEVTLELWQELEGDSNSAKIYGTYKMTPDEKGNWSLTITDLPKATKKADGTKDKDYLYYIKEVSVGGFTLESSENNEGIKSGIIKLVNREQEGYDLPKTGGAGTQLYTTAGLLLILTSAAYLMYIHTNRRREDMDPS